MKVTNTYEKIRENLYRWTVSIDGTHEELEKIKRVTYTLHKSFPNRIIVSTSASTKFSRTTSGWGEFLIKAEAVMKSGEVKYAELWLDLGFDHTKEKKNKYTGGFN